MPGLDLYNRPQDIALTPAAEESVRVLPSPSTGEMIPATNAQGLYAVYGQRNPHSQRAENLRGLAFRQGRGVDFLAPVAAFMAGKAEKKAEDFEATRQGKIDEFMERKKAWDAIKNNREEVKFRVDTLKNEIIPQVRNVYLSNFNKGRDVASKLAAESLNQQTAERNIPAPVFSEIDVWDKAMTGAATGSETGKGYTYIYKDGTFGIQTPKGIEPAPEGLILTKISSADSDRPGGGSVRDDLAEIGSQLNSFRNMKANVLDLSPEEQAQYDALSAEFNRRTGVKPSPTPAPAPTPTPAPPAKPAPQTPWTSGSGNSASPVTAPAPQQAQPLRDANGREIYKGPDGKFYYK